jgi:excisionase family DNA binding protein
MSRPQIILVSQIPHGAAYTYIGSPNFSASPEHLWTCSEAANYLQVHIETVRNYARKRRITYVRLGKCDIRFRKIDLEEFVQSRLNKRRSAYD